jgi:hypothetical protein
MSSTLNSSHGMLVVSLLMCLASSTAWQLAFSLMWVVISVAYIRYRAHINV